MQKQKILIFTGYYLPGFKAGGPIRSIESIVEHFKDDFEYFIITSDRDLGDMEPYVKVSKTEWINLNGIKIYYISRDDCSFRLLRRLITEVQPELMYFNSFFDPCFTIKLLILRKLGLLSARIKVLIAPRGEFAIGALQLKSFKKKMFLTITKIFHLYNNLIWQASSEHESIDIKRWAGASADVCIATNLPPKISNNVQGESTKQSGNLNVVCVARIARNKNIIGALKILAKTKANIVFDLYGPREDVKYWQECEEIIKNMRSNIKVYYKGQVSNDKIRSKLINYHLFFLPTHGENFGHAILEAMSAGLPVLISNLTPWRGLEKKGIGWDIPLSSPEKYQLALEQCANMGPDEYQKLSNRVYDFAESFVNNESAIEMNREMFEFALKK